jgi:hypothetical protein
MAKPQAKIVKQLNGHTLTMVMHGNRWYFVAPWPDFAREYDGCLDTEAACRELERRALAGAQDDRAGSAG